MQITSNTTEMPAGVTVAVDKNGREHCVAVVKGTFVVPASGEPALAEEQLPLVYADRHYGEVDRSSIKYECDFALRKPCVDVLVVGHAYTQNGTSRQAVSVGLRVGAVSKKFWVFGDRRWEKSLVGLRASDPEPFIRMPLIYERAFGGSDHTHEKPKRQGSECRNPVGIGYHKHRDRNAITGTPLPNLEHPDHLIRDWSDTPPPVGLGSVGRGWQPRIGYAGTYDERWKQERFPFLPDDFDDRYFQSAPTDQQLPSLEGGEPVRCTNTNPGGLFEFTVPKLHIPLVFRFGNREVTGEPRLDTVVIEPDERRVQLVWRASVVVGRKLTALREVVVGQQPRHRPKGKRRYSSLGELTAAAARKVTDGS